MREASASSAAMPAAEELPVRSTVVFPAFNAFTTSAAALRVGTSWNSASWRRLLKRTPGAHSTFTSVMFSTVNSAIEGGAEASDTVRKYAQIAHLYLLSVQQLLAQAVHGKNKDGLDIGARVYTSVAGNVVTELVQCHYL